MRFKTLITSGLVLAAVLPTFTARAVHGAVEGCPRGAPRSSAPQWPMPPEENALDVVHFGEGHWNEGQGPKTMPILVQDVIAYQPDFVLFSADIADIGQPDRLLCWRYIIQPAIDSGIPWYQSPGNHDRVAVAGPGGVANGSIDVWREIFATMPEPWGDAPAGPRFLVPKEPDDGKGAATHYYFDYMAGGKPAVRVIVLDNSQHSLTTSDVDQYPAIGPDAEDPSQLAFLERVAPEAEAKGLLTFVVMHQPTQDPRDISNVHPVSWNHTMGKGASPDNLAFDALASASGIDAVLLGHIQGNAVYSVGDTDYFIDGGGGGSPYALREVGTDTGYYYGYRILRVARDNDKWSYRTYLVPLVDSIEISGPDDASTGDEIALEATATQPFDPDLPPRFSGVPNEAITLKLRHPQNSLDARGSVPPLSYMWRTSDPTVLRPVLVPSDPKDDPAFDAGSMTTSGRFKAVGAGTARITILVGTHRETITVRVER